MKFPLDTPRRFRWILNLYPPLWGTGIRVESVSDNFREVVVTMPLTFYNRNAFGGHFGGSLAAMTDPFLTLMLVQVLGAKYRVIDAETHIRFLEQARGKVKALFVIDDRALDRIYSATAGGAKHLEVFTVDVIDESGNVAARVEKTIYVRLRRDLRPPMSATGSSERSSSSS